MWLHLRLLLHTESHGDIYAVWEDVNPESVNNIKEIMASRQSTPTGVRIQYHRVPITAEQVQGFLYVIHLNSLMWNKKAPDFSDISELLRVVIESNLSDTPIILNDQLGRGRSTMATVFELFKRSNYYWRIFDQIIVVLIQQWLAQGAARMRPSASRRSTAVPYESSMSATHSSYQIINSMQS